MEKRDGNIVIRVADGYKNEEITWYSMLDCVVVDYVHKEIKMHPTFGYIYKIPKRYDVKLPACFLKEINVNESIKVENIDYKDIEINDKDYILPKDEKKLDVFFPKTYDKNDGLRHIKEYWGNLLPHNIQSDGLYKKLFYIIRIVEVICAISCGCRSEIEGIEKISKELEKINKKIETDWRKVSTKIYLINAAWEAGKVIGPLGEIAYFRGWHIISMIYAMLWCNSDICLNVDEISAVISIMTDVIKYDAEKNNLMQFGMNIKEKIGKFEEEKWGEAWIIVFLLIRNQKWYYEYVGDMLDSIDMPKYPHKDFEKIFNITQEWMRSLPKVEKHPAESDVDTIEPELVKWLQKNLFALPEEEYKWLMGKLVVSDRSNSTENRYQLKDNFMGELQQLVKPFRFFYFHLLEMYKNDSSLSCMANNLAFWLLVEKILYNYFGRKELPYCNNLDFMLSKEKLDVSLRGNKKHSVFRIANIMKKAATVRSINVVNEFSHFEKLYRIVTIPYKAWILHNYDDKLFVFLKEYHKRSFKRASEDLQYVLNVL